MDHIFTCPECRQKLRLTDEFLGKNVKCPACKSAFRIPTAPEAAGPTPTSVATTRPPAPESPSRGIAEGLKLQDDDSPLDAKIIDEEPDGDRPRRRRKKRRRPTTDRRVGRRFGRLGFPIGMGLLLVFWAVLVGLSFLSKTAAYGLVCGGAITTLVGVGMVLWAAQEDGISLWTFSSSSPMLGVILVSVQVLVIPVLSVVHLVLNFSAAWKPALVLLIGIAMTGSGAALTKVSRPRPVIPEPTEESFDAVTMLTAPRLALRHATGTTRPPDSSRTGSCSTPRTTS